MELVNTNLFIVYQFDTAGNSKAWYFRHLWLDISAIYGINKLV